MNHKMLICPAEQAGEKIEELEGQGWKLVREWVNSDRDAHTYIARFERPADPAPQPAPTVHTAVSVPADSPPATLVPIIAVESFQAWVQTNPASVPDPTQNTVIMPVRSAKADLLAGLPISQAIATYGPEAVRAVLNAQVLAPLSRPYQPAPIHQFSIPAVNS